MINEKTEKLLSRDPVAEAEKMFGGKHWSEFSDGESSLALLMALTDNVHKNDHLRREGDTYSSMSWNRFKSLLAAHGFKMALSYKIERYEHTDEVCIFFEEARGLVIFADSFLDRVNGGRLYAEIKGKPGVPCNLFNVISTGGCVNHEENIWSTSHDVREGLLHNISKIEECADFLPVWTEKDKYLWFIDSTETDQPWYDYVQITQKKIEMCPPELRKIVGR